MREGFVPVEPSTVREAHHTTFALSYFLPYYRSGRSEHALLPPRSLARLDGSMGLWIERGAVVWRGGGRGGGQLPSNKRCPPGIMGKAVRFLIETFCMQPRPTEGMPTFE